MCTSLSQYRLEYGAIYPDFPQDTERGEVEFFLDLFRTYYGKSTKPTFKEIWKEMVEAYEIKREVVMVPYRALKGRATLEELTHWMKLHQDHYLFPKVLKEYERLETEEMKEAFL